MRLSQNNGITIKSISIITLMLISLYFKNKIQRPEISFDPEKSALNFQPVLMKLVSFGNARLISSLMWCHTLLFSDTTHYTDDKSFSWMYYRFKNISEIEPYFFQNYHWGGMYLSVVKDDDLGAEKLLLRGLSFFPKDKYLNFYLGMHYMYELKKYSLANIYFKTSYKNGHPYKTLPSMIAKLDLKNNELDKESYLIPFEAYQNEKNETFKQRYFAIAYKIKAEYDFNCLEKKGDDCENVDLLGKKYFLKNGRWHTDENYQINLIIKK